MIQLTRRELVATSAFGLGGLALPGGGAAAQALFAASGFTHDVASGEPSQGSVLLWTRYVGSGGSARVTAEVSDTADFRRIVAGGVTETGPWRDWTAKVTVDGLQPGTRYYYRFVAADGSRSAVGRTKTLPAGATRSFSVAIFSCANMPFGAFNAYAHGTARDDIDLVIHLGDYFYEYKRGNYPADNPLWDKVLPQTEIVALADYRLRYASYRADPDLRALHTRHPMIVSMDDHESANDCWEGGAENHQPNEGDWATRKMAAIQAWREWMPVDDQPYKAYEIGDLATLFRTDTRLLARSIELEPPPTADVTATLNDFKAKVWSDPARTMMGSPQENWLAQGLAASTAARKRWQVVGVGTVMGEQYMPREVVDWMPRDVSEQQRRRVENGVALAKAGLPFNMDAWGGYPAARARLLGAAQAARANLIVVSGDSHNAWAHDLKNAGRPAGVEFAGHAVTSPGWEAAARGVSPATVAAGHMQASPELRWADTSRRGYMRLALTPVAATNEWVFVDTVASRSLATSGSHTMRVRPGAATLETV